MTDDARLPVSCDCGKIIQQRNQTRHYSSKCHRAFLAKQQSNPSANQSSASPTNFRVDLASYLRETDLRTDALRIQTILQRYENTDPYTKAKLEIENDEHLPTHFHIDHIQEAQILAHAIRHTSQVLPRNGIVSVLRPLRRVLNDASNLAITEASVNQSKGQAVKYFLGQYETRTELPLLAAFIQTASGKERSIAHLSVNIIGLIRETSSSMSEAVRETRMDNGHVAGAYGYEMIADQFDIIIARMRLDWKEGIKLRSGKIYQAYE